MAPSCGYVDMWISHEFSIIKLEYSIYKLSFQNQITQSSTTCHAMVRTRNGKRSFGIVLVNLSLVFVNKL